VIRAAVYGEGLGVERQQVACQELARERGWRIVAAFEDNDVSAYSRKRRPGFEALTDEIEAGRVDAVVTYAVDRLVRRLADLEAVIALAERTGVTIACVTGDLDERAHGDHDSFLLRPTFTA
jgi:DNA invertase Pin-like site-specific DNA recombinase